MHFGQDTTQSAWTFRPILTEPDANNVQQVSAIVVYADPATRFGDNLHTVFFQRVNGNEWQGWAWNTATQQSAFRFINMLMNVAEEDWPLWGVPGLDPLTGDEPRPPQPYMSGMLMDDPLFGPVMQTEDPSQFVALLEAVGYPVASISNRPGLGGGGGQAPAPCENEVVLLRGMAEAVEWAVAQPMPDLASQIAVTQQASTLAFGGCAPIQPPPTNCVYTRRPGSRETIIDGRCRWVPQEPTISGGVIQYCNYLTERRLSKTVRYTYTSATAGCAPKECTESFIATLIGATHGCALTTAEGPCPTKPSCTASPPVGGVCGIRNDSDEIAWQLVSAPCPS